MVVKHTLSHLGFVQLFLTLQPYHLSLLVDMYTENLVLFTQEIKYGESTTSFSNFKGLQKHRKNAGLFIHCGVVAKSIQTIAIFLLFLQKCGFLHKKRKGQLWGFSLRPPRTKLCSFVLFIMAIWTFFDNF